MTDDEIREIAVRIERLYGGDTVPAVAFAHAIIKALERATPAPAQPDPLHVANERGEAK